MPSAMIRAQTSDDELDRLMSRVRAEIAEQDRRGAAAAAPAPAARAPADEPPAKGKRSVRLKNLLRREDEEFVEACFRTILGRLPDQGEAAYHRDRLRDGRLRKLGLIEELRFSKAGRKRGVTIKGLRQRRLLAGLAKIPGVATVASLVRLPRLVGNVHRVRRQTEQLQELVGRLPVGISHDFARLEAGLGARLEGQAAGLAQELAGMRRELAASRDAASGERSLARLPALVDERLQTAQLRLERLLEEKLTRQGQELTGRLGQLERDMGRLHEAVSAGHGRLEEVGERMVTVQRSIAGRVAVPGELPEVEPVPDGGADAFYAAFEDCFRGSREDIRQRQEAHLPLLEGQEARLGSLPVVDLGCGRGEWLELLRERLIPARGVDRNRVFVAENAARGLEVVEADALTHLRGLADGSVRAVTGFHIIEHLPFATLLALLDESLRVLAEGGFALFETPNPENLVTAAHKFYCDPTHRHPIPPEVAAFLLRARGYRDVTVRRLHENADPAREAVADGVLRKLLFGPQDYAVVGYR